MKINKTLVKCDYCDKDKLVYLSDNVYTKKHFCDIKCKGLYQKGKKWSDEQKAKLSAHMLGENNPNYGKFWSDDKKISQGALISSRMDTYEIKLKCSKANKGVKFTEDRIANMHAHRTPESYDTSVYFTEDTLLKISQSSRDRFKDDKYKSNIMTKGRETKLLNGSILKPSDRSPYELYYLQTEWQGNVLININKHESDMILELGFYNPNINKIGVVRDHMYSRKYGLINGIFPEILKHPCNCAIITNSENARKGQTYSNSIEIEELFQKIETFKGIWSNQDLTLNLISVYRQGYRWDINYDYN